MIFIIWVGLLYIQFNFFFLKPKFPFHANWNSTQLFSNCVNFLTLLSFYFYRHFEETLNSADLPSRMEHGCLKCSPAEVKGPVISTSWGNPNTGRRMVIWTKGKVSLLVTTTKVVEEREVASSQCTVVWYQSSLPFNADCLGFTSRRLYLLAFVWNSSKREWGLREISLISVS